MRIAMISAYGYWGDFLPTDLKTGNKQIGGGETALINVAKELAGLGHDVKVFYNVKRSGRYDGVDYLPLDLFVPMMLHMEWDHLVAWDAPHAFRFADRAKKHTLVFQLNDAQVGVFDHAIDYYFHPSKWHADRFAELYPEITRTKQWSALTNGIDPLRYTADVERDPYRVIYSSSPDRGLHHLLRLWPLVVEKEPRANLHVYYDINKWLGIIADADNAGMHLVTTDRAHELKALIDKGLPNVTFHGGVGQAELAKAQLSAAVMAYSCDPVAPTEGFSMSCLEGITAGCNLITTNADALADLWTSAPNTTILPLPVDDDVWAATILDKLGVGERRIVIPEHYMWSSIAKKWEEAWSRG